MRVFLTGATGFIGSRIVPELIGAGHQVLGLTRSDAGAEALAAAGAEVYRGNLEDPDGLRRGADTVDAVIHTAFDHDFSSAEKFLSSTEKDRRVIAALGEARRPLIITSGVGLGSRGPGELASEDHYDVNHPNPRKASEEAGQAMAEKGVDIRVVRLPQVHDTVKQGLISPLIELARSKGLSGYVGEGQNRYSAAHVLDVARLYRLVLERGEAGRRYNAVAEEGVPLRLIAETVARGLGIPARSLTPEEASEHFGWMAMFAGMDLPASSALTRERLGWTPTGPGLIRDLEAMDYSAG
jgi:nucleoside-diphosphate-sugar epimerase